MTEGHGEAEHRLQQPGFQGEGGPQHLTLADFFTVSALLSLLEVLAALGEFRPLERMSSLMGEARPSGLAGCFFRPLRSVDICPPQPEAGETGPQFPHRPPEPQSQAGASRAGPPTASWQIPDPGLPRGPLAVPGCTGVTMERRKEGVNRRVYMEKRAILSLHRKRSSPGTVLNEASLPEGRSREGSPTP